MIIKFNGNFPNTTESVLLGTSNWSGDYFDSVGTGAAIIIKQNSNGFQPLIEDMRHVFERDFESPNAYTLTQYYDGCIGSKNLADFCETEKDVSFLASPPSSHV